MTTRSTAAVLLCAGATAAAAAPAAQASTAASEPATARALQPQARGLFDGLLGGTTALAPITPAVTSLVDQLLPTQTGSLLGVTELTNVVATLVDTGALGTVTAGTLLAEVPVLDDLVAGTVQTVTGGTLSGDLVGSLLANGVALGQLPAVVDQLLSSAGAPQALVDSLVGDVVADILAVGLPTDAGALQAVVDQLTGGAAPTGSLLQPVAGVLDALAANAALPVELRTVAGELAATVRTVGTATLPTDVVVRISEIVGGVAALAGTPRPVSDALANLANLLRMHAGSVGPGPSTRTPFRVTKAMRAKVRRVTVTKDRRQARAVIVCPAGALAGCYTTTRLRFAGAAAGRPVVRILRPGQARTIKLRLPARVRSALRRRGGAIAVRVVSVTQDGNVSASRTERVARRRR